MDSKWLDVLRATGWQSGAVAVACVVLYWMIDSTALPDPGPAIRVLIAAGAMIGAALAVAAIAKALEKPVGDVLRSHLRASRMRQKIRSSIPHLTEHEREIFGYLVHKNEKTFMSAADGGYAATLIGQGFIVQTLRAGQIFDPEHVPCVVPEVVWHEIVKHKDQLPKPKKGASHPWRISWMVRG